MSKVATAESEVLVMTPAPLSRRWVLTVESGSLKGLLKALHITDQHEAPFDPFVIGLLGNVWTAGNEVDVLSLIRGETYVEGGQQFLSFEIIFKGSRYAFSGMLNAERTLINDGRIDKAPLMSTEPDTLAEDGTWSAKAEPGGPGEPRRPNPRGRTSRHPS